MKEGSSEERSTEMLGEVLGLLAHDIRNPLAALSSNVGFLSMVGADLSEDLKEAIVDLQLSLEVLGRIADTVEVLSHELRALPVPGTVRLSVKSTLTALLPAVERAAASHGVSVALAPFEEASVSVAEPSFSRALAHLLHNAISLAPPRSTVELAVVRRDREIGFVVRDEGPRLVGDFESAAFSLRGQLDAKGRAEGRYSRGMGLYMVGRSAALAGARIAVDSSGERSAIGLWVPSV